MRDHVLIIHPLSNGAKFLLNSFCVSPYVYNYSDGRWWFTDQGLEYWLFDDETGIRIVENPF